MVRFKLAILIPAFNEASTISKVVESLLGFGEIIVSDDGSSDETARLAHNAGAIVVGSNSNGGYESALNLAFEHALKSGFTHAITFDADGQHDAQAIMKIRQALLNGSTLVVGSRKKPQRVAEWIFGMYTKIRWGQITDPLSGLKGYELNFVKEIGHFDCGKFVGTELLIAALKRKERITQIEFATSERIGKPRFAGRIQANIRIIKALIKVGLSGHI